MSTGHNFSSRTTNLPPLNSPSLQAVFGARGQSGKDGTRSGPGTRTRPRKLMDVGKTQSDSALPVASPVEEILLRTASRRSLFSSGAATARGDGGGEGERRRKAVGFREGANEVLSAAAPPATARPSAVRDMKASLDALSSSTVSNGDISYRRRERAGNEGLPGTAIPDEHHVVVNSALPSGPDSTYDSAKKLWRTTVFPSQKPTSRQEVAMLDQWCSQMLASRDLVVQPEQLAAMDALDRDAYVHRVIQTSQAVYAMAFGEIVRQVSVSCVERGQLLTKIWQRYFADTHRTLDSITEEHEATTRQLMEDAAARETVLRDSKQGALDELRAEMEGKLRAAMRERDAFDVRSQDLANEVGRLEDKLAWYKEKQTEVSEKINDVYKKLVRIDRERKHWKFQALRKDNRTGEGGGGDGEGGGAFEGLSDVEGDISSSDEEEDGAADGAAGGGEDGEDGDNFLAKDKELASAVKDMMDVYQQSIDVDGEPIDVPDDMSLEQMGSIMAQTSAKVEEKAKNEMQELEESTSTTLPPVARRMQARMVKLRSMIPGTVKFGPESFLDGMDELLASLERAMRLAESGVDTDLSQLLSTSQMLAKFNFSTDGDAPDADTVIKSAVAEGLQDHNQKMEKIERRRKRQQRRQEREERKRTVEAAKIERDRARARRREERLAEKAQSKEERVAARARRKAERAAEIEARKREREAAGAAASDGEDVPSDASDESDATDSSVYSSDEEESDADLVVSDGSVSDDTEEEEEDAAPDAKNRRVAFAAKGRDEDEDEDVDEDEAAAAAAAAALDDAGGDTGEAMLADEELTTDDIAALAARAKQAQLDRIASSFFAHSDSESEEEHADPLVLEESDDGVEYDSDGMPIARPETAEHATRRNSLTIQTEHSIVTIVHEVQVDMSTLVGPRGFAESDMHDFGFMNDSSTVTSEYWRPWVPHEEPVRATEDTQTSLDMDAMTALESKARRGGGGGRRRRRRTSGSGSESGSSGSYSSYSYSSDYSSDGEEDDDAFAAALRGDGQKRGKSKHRYRHSKRSGGEFGHIGRKRKEKRTPRVVQPKFIPKAFINLFQTNAATGTKTSRRSVAWVLKYISQIYADKIHLDAIDDREERARSFLPEFTFDFHLNKYGLRRLAEKQIVEFLAAVHEHQDHHPRIELFARFCGMDGKSLNLACLNFYLSVLANMRTIVEDSPYTGHIFLLKEHSDMQLCEVRVSHAMECLRTTFSETPADTLTSFSVRLLGGLLGGPFKNATKVDLDLLATTMLLEWKRLYDRFTLSTDCIFLGGDIDNDELLSFEEFRRVMLHITPNKERKELQRLYNLAMMDTDRLIGVNGLTMELWGRLMQRLGTHTFNCSPPQLAIGENTAPNWEYLDMVWKRLEPTLMQELEDLAERRPTAEAKLRSYFLAFRALLVARERPDIAWSSLHMLIKDVEHYRREQKAFGGKYGQRAAKGTISKVRSAVALLTEKDFGGGGGGGGGGGTGKSLLASVASRATQLHRADTMSRLVENVPVGKSAAEQQQQPKSKSTTTSRNVSREPSLVSLADSDTGSTSISRSPSMSKVTASASVKKSPSTTRIDDFAELPPRAAPPVAARGDRGARRRGPPEYEAARAARLEAEAAAKASAEEREAVGNAVRNSLSSQQLPSTVSLSLKDFARGH